MAVFEYTVEGIYETDKGSGKDYTPFNFKIKLPRFENQTKGAGTHILRRFLPILIRNMKGKPLLSGIRHWVITNIQKVSDDFPLEGKEIALMSEQEIQELACMYDLIEIPLPSTMAISELREKAQQAYMKKVLKIPMNTIEEQEQCAFFKRQADGSLKFDLGEEKLKVEIVENFIGKKVEVKKKTLADFIKNAGQSVANGILAMTGNVDNGEGQPNGNDGSGQFPSMADLQNGTAGTVPNPPLN